MIGDYVQVGWSVDTPKPVNSINLQNVDEKVYELDAHLKNMEILGNAIIGPAGHDGYSYCDGGMSNSIYAFDQIIDCGGANS